MGGFNFGNVERVMATIGAACGAANFLAMQPAISREFDIDGGHYVQIALAYHWAILQQAAIK